MGFHCVSRTHVGLRRKLNEDAVLNCAGRSIWAVADGMGGHEAGEVASAKIIEALSTITASADSLENRVDHAVTLLESVNAALMDLGNASGEQRTIGSTIVGLIVDEDSYACFWVGDSRAYLLRGDEISQLSHDHSLVQELVDTGMLRADEAEGHPNANVVMRAVGAKARLQVDVVMGSLNCGDLFLLASDGLTRMVRDDELLLELSTNLPAPAADRLIELTLERGAPDNVSLVIVQVGTKPRGPSA